MVERLKYQDLHKLFDKSNNGQNLQVKELEDCLRLDLNFRDNMEIRTFVKKVFKNQKEVSLEFLNQM